MKLITNIDKNDCYEVIDGQNHYLVPFDYGCYAYKDIIKDENHRCSGIKEWKAFCAQYDVVKMIIPIPWLKFVGTRGKTIKDSILKLSTTDMNLDNPFCVQTRSGEYLVVSAKPPFCGIRMYVGEYQGFRYRVEWRPAGNDLMPTEHTVIWRCVKEPVLKPISITNKR